MAAIGMTAFAQNKATATPSKSYYRVEFTVPIVGTNSGSNTSVAATMKDDYTYCNPEHQYLDFQADNGMWFRTTTTNVTENSSFYLENGRTAQGGAAAKYPYLVDKIKKITAYSQPVQTVTLVDSTTTHNITFVGDGKTYKGAEFTFNRLPRNVAELKTLIEDAQGNRVEACKNPLFVAAVGYLVWPTAARTAATWSTICTARTIRSSTPLVSPTPISRTSASAGSPTMAARTSVASICTTTCSSTSLVPLRAMLTSPMARTTGQARTKCASFGILLKHLRHPIR